MLVHGVHIVINAELTVLFIQCIKE